MRGALTALTLCALTASALAQPEPTSLPPEPTIQPGSEPAPDAVQPDPRSDPAWELYHRALEALVRGKRTRAAKLAGELQRNFAGHPATTLVAQSSLALGPSELDTPPGPSREAPSRSARAELALFQTIHGLAVGIEICVAADCNDAGAVFGIALAGAGAGALFSLEGVPKTLTSGQRALINSGTAWGAINAGLLIVAVQPDDEQTAVPLTLMVGQGAGIVGGAAMFQFGPTAGQVGLANSGGQWAGALTALTYVALNDNPDDQHMATTLLVAVDAGLIGGGLLAQRYPNVSRAQTLVIDAGGIVGAVGGGGLGVLIAGDNSDRTVAGLAAIGAAAGLGAAAYLTRHWGDHDSDDDDAPNVRAVIAPATHGRGAIAGLGGTW